MLSRGLPENEVSAGVLNQMTTIEIAILSGEVDEFVDQALDRKRVEGYLDIALGPARGPLSTST